MWGLIAIGFASIGSLFENLIQFVNIIGSIFYGTVLGIFLSAFLIRRMSSIGVFVGALFAQIDRPGMLLDHRHRILMVQCYRLRWRNHRGLAD